MNGTVRAYHHPNAAFTAAKPQLMADSGKIDIESLATAFRTRLGAAKWEIYREMLTKFLVGKLSRVELIRGLREQLHMESSDLRRHNTLVLALLANAVRTSPSSAALATSADGLANSHSVLRGHVDLRESREQRLFREVLALPARERRRIKAIVKETPAGGALPLVPPPPPVLLAARHAMLPHLPYLPDTRARTAPKGINARIVFDKTAQAAAQAAQAAAQANRAPNSATMPTGKFPGLNYAGSAGNSAPGGKETSSPLTDPLLNLAPGRASGPLTWTQDIIQGLDAPLIAETHEFPEDSALCTRMLSVALENGLLQGIGAGVTDIMLLGLESYLRSIVDQLTSQCHRQISSQNPLTVADLDLLLRAQPAELGEHMAPAMRLRTQYLHDEITVEPRSPESSDLETAAVRKRVSPWDLTHAKRTRSENMPKSVEKLLSEHESGRALASSLLN